LGLEGEGVRTVLFEQRYTDYGRGSVPLSLCYGPSKLALWFRNAPCPAQRVLTLLW
jgi:hypothetical protein